MSGSYTHVLEREQRLALPIETVFAFYGQARNLEQLTPPWMGFHVLTPEPIEMRQGTLIDYRLSLRGVPLRWRTRIELWDPPTRFIDLQLRGPYSLWEHLHTFRADGDGATVIGDRVRYRLPLGPLGQLAHALLVRGDLQRVFDYREQVVAERIEHSAAGV